MPPIVATTVVTAFILWLLVRDHKANPTVTSAVWIPLLWMSIHAGRMVKEWVNGFWVGGAIADNNLDRNTLLILIIAGLVVVTKRSLSWPTVLSSNVAGSLFLLYAFSSMIWSDEPLTAFIQWHRMVGHGVMFLVIATEPDPERAFNAVFKRCGYAMIPLSVLFIKYYPELGRRFNDWGGVENVGVAAGKNIMGALAMVMCVFFLNYLLVAQRGKEKRVDRYATLLLIGMAIWLLKVNESSTARFTAFASCMVVISFQSAAIRRHSLPILIVGGLFLAVVRTTTDFDEVVITALGEDTTLTGRTDLWADLNVLALNPLIGAGFENFWVGERRNFLWRKYWWRPTQAHNGYLESYLNVGIVGMVLQAAMVLVGYLRSRKQLLHESDESTIEKNARDRFTLPFILTFLLFNMTEASFRPTGLLFFVLMILVLDYPPVRKQESPATTLQRRPLQA